MLQGGGAERADPTGHTRQHLPRAQPTDQVPPLGLRTVYEGCPRAIVENQDTRFFLDSDEPARLARKDT